MFFRICSDSHTFNLKYGEVLLCSNIPREHARQQRVSLNKQLHISSTPPSLQSRGHEKKEFDKQGSIGRKEGKEKALKGEQQAGSRLSPQPDQHSHFAGIN